MNQLLSALVQLGIIDNATAQRINRNLSPDEAQAWAESTLMDAFTSGLDAQRFRLLDLVDATNGRPSARQLAEFWRREDDAFFRSVQPALYEIAQERAIVSIVQSGGADMWEAINEAVIGWVEDYYTNIDIEAFGSIPNLNDFSRTEFGRIFNLWQRGELETAGYADGLPQLIRAIEPTFGQVRAERIAVTESTRIYYESTYQAANANPYIVALRWYTAADERVCPICGPNHTIVVPKAQRVWPNGATIPAHPNCRCRAIEETALTLGTPLPPEEQWQYTPPPPKTPRTPKNVKYTPAGTPIGGTMKASAPDWISKTGEYSVPGYDLTKDVAPSLDAINSVHGVGDLPAFSVSPFKSDNAYGVYAIKNNSIGLHAEIMSNPKRVMATFTHEVGHMLDRVAIVPGGNGFASEQNAEILKGWREAIEKSKTIKTLRDMQSGKISSVTNSEGRVFTPDGKFLDYLLNPSEMWARSYAQYIAKRSNSIALDIVNGQSNRAIPTQWDDDDFEPIAKAIDAVFLKLGWIK